MLRSVWVPALIFVFVSSSGCERVGVENEDVVRVEADAAEEAEAEVAQVEADAAPFDRTSRAAAPSISLVRLKGTIRYPQGWSRCLIRGDLLPSVKLEDGPEGSTPRAIFVPFAEATESGGFLEASFDLGQVFPGSYVLRLHPYGFRAALHVPAGGSVEHEIVLPQPAHVVLRLVPMVGSETVDISELICWRADDSRVSKKIVRDAESGAFEFCMLPGEIGFLGSGEGFELPRTRRSVAAGTNHLELACRPR